MEGYLGKKARGESTMGRKNWKKRWFILENQTLSYYESINFDTGELGTRKGTVDVAETTVEAAEYEGKTFTFHLLHKSNKPVILQSSDEKTMNIWIKALGEAARGENLFEPPNYPSCYELLGLREANRPSSADVEHAFRRLSLQKHPDKGGDPAEFKQLQNSYYALLHRIQEDEDKMKFKQVKYEAVLRKGGEGSGLGVIVKEDAGARLIRIKGILPEIQLVSFQTAGRAAQGSSGLIEAGGIKINDALLKVGNEDVRNMPLLRVAQKLSDLRVAPNTTVQLTLQRKEPRIAGGADAAAVESLLRSDADAADDTNTTELGADESVAGSAASGRRKSVKKNKEERRASRKSIKMSETAAAATTAAAAGNDADNATTTSSIAAAWGLQAAPEGRQRIDSSASELKSNSQHDFPSNTATASATSTSVSAAGGTYYSQAGEALAEAMSNGRMPDPNDILAVLAENEQMTRELSTLRERAMAAEQLLESMRSDKDRLEFDMSRMQITLSEQQEAMTHQQQQHQQQQYQQQQEFEQQQQQNLRQAAVGNQQEGGRIVRGSGGGTAAAAAYSRSGGAPRARSMSPDMRNRHSADSGAIPHQYQQHQLLSPSGRSVPRVMNSAASNYPRNGQLQPPPSPGSSQRPAAGSKSGAGDGNVLYPEEYNPNGDSDPFMYPGVGTTPYGYGESGGFYEYDGQQMQQSGDVAAGGYSRNSSSNNAVLNDASTRGVGPGGSGYVPRHTQSSQAKHITNRMLKQQEEEMMMLQQQQQQYQQQYDDRLASSHAGYRSNGSGSRSPIALIQTVSDPAAIARVASNNLRNPYRQPAPYKATRKVPVPAKTFKAM